ncbi:efflux RND transporter permease subunit, partial [Niveispirillum fermenti]|uniref:efflux RND transporter permease subunit n=1 Tax=Niveispirillum fermenti TaxID=1233113 RepID=UPI003A8C2ECE
MHFTDLFIRRPILSVVVSLLIFLVGVTALFGLPIRQYPNLESATITVETRFPGATQEVMQGFVTQPIAQSIATASGIEYLTSISTMGRSQVKAKLVLNADSDRALTEILAKVQQVKYRLPEGAFDPVVAKITDGASAVQYIAFTSDQHSPAQLTDFVTRVAQPMFTSIRGVASVDTFGGSGLAMRVWIDPVKMAARGLAASDIAMVLRANNVQAAPGQLNGGLTITDITATTDLRSLDDFRDMVIKTGDEGLVRLRDIATVEIGAQNYDSSAASDGKRGVIVALTPTPDGNPLEIVKGANSLIPVIQKSAPPGVEVRSTFDVAHFV